MLYETEEEYIQGTLDGFESTDQKQESIDKTIKETDGRFLNSRSGPGSSLYPKVKSWTVFDWFKESGDDGFVGQKIVYLRPARVP